jgi:hypothetical protein
MSAWTYDSSTESNLMKVKYGKLQEKQFNKKNILFGRSKKAQDFVGSQIEFPVEQSIGGGVSAGSLPTANRNKHGKAIITSKKLYGATSVDRESMKASKTSEGAFVQFTKHSVKTLTQSFNRNLERQMVRGDASGSGALITGVATDSVVTGAGTSGSPYVISFDTASTYFPAEFECIEEGDILNAGTETTELEVVAVSVTAASGYATGTISVVGTSALLADDAAATATAFEEALYMQKSKDNEIIGVAGVLSATSGSLYNIAVGRRWQAYRKNASAALSTDLLNDAVMNLKRQCGEAPNLIMMSYHQYIAYLDLLEDAKVFNIPARDKKFTVSYSAIEYISPDGVIPVVPSRFMDSDKIYLLNDSKIKLHLRPGGFEWFDEDGTVFLRNASSDEYDARYGGYGQYFINPHFQAEIYNVTV